MLPQSPIVYNFEEDSVMGRAAKTARKKSVDVLLSLPFLMVSVSLLAIFRGFGGVILAVLVDLCILAVAKGWYRALSKIEGLGLESLATHPVRYDLLKDRLNATTELLTFPDFIWRSIYGGWAVVIFVVVYRAIFS